MCRVSKKICAPPAWLLWEGGFGVSWVVDWANFSPKVSGFTFKSYKFYGSEVYHGLRVWPFLVQRFWVFP